MGFSWCLMGIDGGGGAVVTEFFFFFFCNRAAEGAVYVLVWRCRNHG